MTLDPSACAPGDLCRSMPMQMQSGAEGGSSGEGDSSSSSAAADATSPGDPNGDDHRRAKQAAKTAAKAVVFAKRNAQELQDIYEWGRGIKGIQQARATLDAARMGRIQGALSREEVEAARDMYNSAAELGEGGNVAPERGAYMEEILNLWK